MKEFCFVKITRDYFFSTGDYRITPVDYKPWDLLLRPNDANFEQVGECFMEGSLVSVEAQDYGNLKTKI